MRSMCVHELQISTELNHKLHAKLPAKLSATYTSILRLDEVGALEFLLFVLGTDIKDCLFENSGRTVSKGDLVIART